MIRSSLVITIDRLNPSFLGPYGGTSAGTPNFNRLAAQSLLVEHAISDSADLDVVFRSFWQGVHACVPPQRITEPSVIERLTDAGVATVLVTDDREVAAHPLAEFFAERVELPSNTSAERASDVEETQLAQSLAAALETLAELRSPFLLWIHLSGMSGPWDAPAELLDRVRGDDDPPPRLTAETPAMRLAPDYDPDELLPIAQAYAAQAMLVDMGLGVLLGALAEHPARNELLLLLTSPRGFPLGEHLLVGDADAALYDELLHVPLLLRRAGGVGAMARDQSFAQPADIAATLLDWHNLPCPSASPQAASLLALTEGQQRWPREQTLSIAADQRGTRTSAWYLRESPASAELFSKPDDRFEANEVSSLCPAIVDELLSAATQLERALVADDFTQIAPLPPALVEGTG